jgi:3-ketosteroid 9alpha-monooxygenase subunit B
LSVTVYAMGESPTHAGRPERGFHPLTVRSVTRETAEAVSFGFEDAHGYRPGQFLTFRLQIDGAIHLRSYSMSSCPGLDPVLAVTVKRVPGGVVSNWMVDHLNPGDVVEATAPAGTFCLGPGGGDIVAFSAGSGITPVFSIVKHALATTTRRIRLLYANRDGDSVIFGAALDELATRYPERLEVVHRLDVDEGFLDGRAVEAFLGAGAGPGREAGPGRGAGPGAGAVVAEYFVCGPEPFMRIVEATLVAARAGEIHLERFSSVEGAAAVEPELAVAGPARVTIELDGRVVTADHRPGTTILQVARQMGMKPPYSCEAGNCATCMGRVVEGAVKMRVNDALTPEEVEEGWVLTCQSVPTTPSVRVIYGYEEA